jgi:hypothetical protein
MVLEHQHEYPSQWTAIISIAGKFGMTCETCGVWVRQVEVDVGERPGGDHDRRGSDQGARACATTGSGSFQKASGVHLVAG